MENGNTHQRPPLVTRLVFGSNPAMTVVRILVVILASLILFKFVLLPIRVTGESMHPTFNNGQIKLVNRLAYRKKDPERGDIVAGRYEGDQVLLLKRVVALPGEVVRVQAGDLYINNRKLVEPYAVGKIPYEKGAPGYMPPKTLGPDEYVVLGDNRKISEGYFMKRDEIIGKVL